MSGDELGRRTFLKVTGGAVSTLAFPAIAKSQTKMDEVEIAIVYPLSGPAGSIGTNAVRGWHIAVEEINAAGGIKSLGGAKIKTILADHQSKPRIGMAEVEKVARNKKVPLVVGCWNSSVTFPASQISEQYGLPHLIGMSSQSTILRRGFKYVFRITMESERMGARLVEFVESVGAKTGHKAKRAALMSLDGNFGKSSADSIVKAIGRGTGQTVVENIFYPGKTTNVDIEVAKIKAAKPDVIYLTSFLPGAVLTTRALHAQKVDCMGFVTYSAGFGAPKYLESVGKLSEYFYAISKFDHDKNRAMEVQFDGKMMKRHNVHADHFSGALYSMAYLVKDVLERAGTVDRDKVREAVASTNISSGRALMLPGNGIKFDKNGENQNAADLVAQVRNGSWHTVWPYEWKREMDPAWPMPTWKKRGL